MFASSRRIETCIVWPWKVKVKIWPQVKVTWWPKKVILHMYRCVLMGETQWDHSHVSISFGSKVIRKKTVGDLRWPQMTFGGSPMKTVAWVITEDLSQHHSQWMEMFWCEKEVVEILPIDLTWAGHKIDLTSGHEYKKSKIYKLLELVTSSTSKSLTTLGS